MNEKWIGPEDNTSGSYYAVESCKELRRRTGGHLNAMKLYKFNSRFGEEYYITDDIIITEIEKVLEFHDSSALYEYLYNLVIQKFGVLDFIEGIDHKIAHERDVRYREGKLCKQQEIREVLGI
ncbi:hypothetical protein [Paenibacillus oleatilyticus]|uniref:hypothetical protein n=1 Tax=Paenibacillus oleatilyticus TaxID=2594886 RepID=UPI001C1FCA62|nr:hypothetical protein [Paenibacillus oleatilyticus]MBU7316080.1 hypothetical protein [Paenibacillus oleatilyticus]